MDEVATLLLRRLLALLWLLSALAPLADLLSAAQLRCLTLCSSTTLFLRLVRLLAWRSLYGRPARLCLSCEVLFLLLLLLFVSLQSLAAHLEDSTQQCRHENATRVRRHCQ